MGSCHNVKPIPINAHERFIKTDLYAVFISVNDEDIKGKNVSFALKEKLKILSNNILPRCCPFYVEIDMVEFDFILQKIVVSFSFVCGGGYEHLHAVCDNSI